MKIAETVARQLILIVVAAFYFISSGFGQIASSVPYEFSHLAGSENALPISGDVDGKGSSARFSSLHGLAVDQTGNCFVASLTTIRKISPSGVVSTIAGKSGESIIVDGNKTTARFSAAKDVAVGANGSVYVVDQWAIRVIAADGEVRTLAGATRPGYRDGVGVAAQFDRPSGVAVGPSGDVFVADYGNAVIRKIFPTGIVSTLAGKAGARGESDGVGADARFQYPMRIAIDSAGAIHVADVNLNSHAMPVGYRFRKISPDGMVTTIADVAMGFEETQLFYLSDMAVDATGNLFLVDASDRVRRLSSDGTMTVVDAREAGVEKDVNGPGSVTRLHSPTGIDVDAAGNLYIADSESFIRKGIPIWRNSKARLANISLRGRVGKDDETLILGFVIGGSERQSVLVRGLGPSLTNFGVRENVADPALRLYDSAGIVLENDNWGSSADLRTIFASVGAASLADISKDAALAVALQPGPYTMHIVSHETDSGVALAEVYDADLKGTSRLVNLSGRVRTGPGEDVLIAGFVIAGDTPKTVLIRGLGPHLAKFGVRSSLPDPTLTLFGDGAAILRNDNWGGAETLKNVFAQVGAFELPIDDSKDAVLLVSLLPGVYTVQLADSNGATGVGMIEIYAVP